MHLMRRGGPEYGHNASAESPTYGCHLPEIAPGGQPRVMPAAPHYRRRRATCLLLAMAFFATLPCSASDHGGTTDSATNIQYVRTASFQINLGDGRFLVFTPVFKARGPHQAAQVSAFMPVLRHEIIKSLIGLGAEDVSGSTFIASYATGLRTIANAALGKDLVELVVFEDWLVY
jgi:hypothetical protein